MAVHFGAGGVVFATYEGKQNTYHGNVWKIEVGNGFHVVLISGKDLNPVHIIYTFQSSFITLLSRHFQMNKFCLLISMVFFSQCAQKNNKKTYELNIVCPATSSLSIKSIEVTNTLTIIKLTSNPPLDRGQVYPPGNENAFVIRDATSTKTYKLLNAEGITIAPMWGKVKDFTLTFEPIPSEMHKFHLIEGNDINSGTPWNFMNIELSEK